MSHMYIYVGFPDAVTGSRICTKCLMPTTKTYVLELVDIDGITPIGTRVACKDCQVWLTRLKEI